MRRATPLMPRLKVRLRLLIVLLLVFLGVLNVPLSAAVNYMWDRLVELTAFVDVFWG